MGNLQSKAEAIRDERRVGKNTSDRVGGLLAEITEEIEVLKSWKGKGLTILGYYGTLDLLKAAVSNPKPGDAYGIGTEAPYNIYVFDRVTSDWVDNGAMSGGGEGGGNIVLIPMEVLSLTSTSTSAEVLTAFGGKEAFNDIVDNLSTGNAIPVILASDADSFGGTPCFLSVYNYVDYSNLRMQIMVAVGADTLMLLITVADSVFSLEKITLSALQAADLVSDPTAGGIDKPASAEAVKMVNQSKVSGGGYVTDIIKITQSDYDALPIKNDTTLYIII